MSAKLPNPCPGGPKPPASPAPPPDRSLAAEVERLCLEIDRIEAELAAERKAVGGLISDLRRANDLHDRDVMADLARSRGWHPLAPGESMTVSFAGGVAYTVTRRVPMETTP